MAETITVTQLNNRVKNILSNNPSVTNIWVSCEISGLKQVSSGHSYMTLKDENGQINAVMFASARSRLDFQLKDNMKVTAFGSVDIYAPRGSYQFIIQAMRQSGIGDLYQKFEELKIKLKGEGLFDESRKRPIPQYPRVIGVVTSSTGAVIHDIITTSATRFPSDILLSPSLVQGEGAAETIVAGIELLNSQGVDVIIVGRGGGSIEDLWPFNEEIVARAIASSKAPVVSAVGHETDFTIADFVADKRAPTPTGAAALILRDRMEMRSEIDHMFSRCTMAFRRSMDARNKMLEVLDARISSDGTANHIALHSLDLDQVWNRIQGHMTSMMKDEIHRMELFDAQLSPEATVKRLEVERDRMESIFSRISVNVNNTLSKQRLEFKGIESLLESVNPDNVLQRGYSLVTDEDGNVVTSVDSISEGMGITVRMRDGRIGATVKNKVRSDE